MTRRQPRTSGFCDRRNGVSTGVVCRQIRQRPEWIVIAQISNQSQKQMYRARLHDGEAEVMILAREAPEADLVIIDDNAAKKTAKLLGLSVTGTPGVLLRAKKMGLVDAVAPIIDELYNTLLILLSG